MKFCIVLLTVVAVVCAEEMASESMKSKRGLSLSLGYHASPLVSHSYVAPAPYIAHSAPLVAAAPVYHAPIAKTYVAHAPIVHHGYHAYHAPAVAVAHAPVAYAHAPLYSAFHRR
ncbi:larval/pupal cuticle protein H1C-like [Wyeomyia smithii]|uniref:larval/pupal cuticle protein H1C-like n=1 Tax=Wyeomyia smithii TaxID=174621 RepID=UPI002467AE36|nr:larval/pupal cuticle protein H1C-like [Wyeomyia smithii]